MHFNRPPVSRLQVQFAVSGSDYLSCLKVSDPMISCLFASKESNHIIMITVMLYVSVIISKFRYNSDVSVMSIHCNFSYKVDDLTVN